MMGATRLAGVGSPIDSELLLWRAVILFVRHLIALILNDVVVQVLNQIYNLGHNRVLPVTLLLDDGHLFVKVGWAYPCPLVLLLSPVCEVVLFLLDPVVLLCFVQVSLTESEVPLAHLLSLSF